MRSWTATIIYLVAQCSSLNLCTHKKQNCWQRNSWTTTKNTSLFSWNTVWFQNNRLWLQNNCLWLQNNRLRIFIDTEKKRNKLLSILVWMLTPKINRSHQIPIDDVIQNERSRSASTIYKLDYFYKIIIINIYYDWSRQAMVKWLKRACAVLLLKSITIVPSILEIA